MGKRRLEDAIRQLDHPVEVTYRCFELDPNMSKNVKENIYQSLARKYGMSEAQARANTQNMVQMAREVGLDYKMDTLIQTNTFDAHRLTMFAKTKGLMKEMTERLLRAYFIESKHIGDHQTLTELAVEVGLNREAAEEMLASNEMADVVRTDERMAKQIGVTGVPFFVINNKYALSGAQPTEVFVQALKKIAAEDQIVVLNNLDGAACDDDGCEIPKK
ncbi:DsbA family oxidoreductase [Pseudoneobacillus sp. C159]